MKTKLKFILSLMLVTMLTFSISVEAATISSPTISSALNASKGIEVKWKRNSSCDGYYVYRKVGSGKYYKITTINKNSTTTYLDEKVSNGKTYTYKMKAYKGSSTSSYSDVKTVKRVDYPTISVSNKNAGVRIKWGKIEGATKYRVYYKNGNSWVKLKDTTSTSYIDEVVKSGETRTYAVRAYNETYYSCRSNNKTIMRLNSPVITRSGGGFKWNAVDGASSYNVYRKRAGESSFTKIATTKNTSYVDNSNLLPEITYTYIVKAVNGNYISSYDGTFSQCFTQLVDTNLIDSFKEMIPADVTGVVFTTEKVPVGYEFGTKLDGANCIDVSADNNKSVLAWMKDDVLYVSTQLSNKKVVAPLECSEMFKDKTELTFVDFTNLNTLYVKNMSKMFYGCYSLETLDLSKFKTTCVNDMSSMFEGCQNLEVLNLENFSTSYVTTMNRMFFDCNSLSELNILKFNTSKVTDMGQMFYRCLSLESLDLSSFKLSKVTNMNDMFFGCSSLKTILVSNAWDVTNVKNSKNMFKLCKSIVGQSETKYNSKKIDKTMANYTTGYLTLK